MPSVEWNRRWQRDLREFSEQNPEKVYGIQWGDPEVRGLRYFFQLLRHPGCGIGPLYKVVDRYIRPYVGPSSTVLEIGAGGGRWTRYLLGARRIICVDLNPEFFDVLKARFPGSNLNPKAASSRTSPAIPWILCSVSVRLYTSSRKASCNTWYTYGAY
jgi:SAM-dependent methyltransferase